MAQGIIDIFVAKLKGILPSTHKGYVVEIEANETSLQKPFTTCTKTDIDGVWNEHVLLFVADPSATIKFNVIEQHWIQEDELIATARCKLGDLLVLKEKSLPLVGHRLWSLPQLLITASPCDLPTAFRSRVDALRPRASHRFKTFVESRVLACRLPPHVLGHIEKALTYVQSFGVKAASAVIKNHAVLALAFELFSLTGTVISNKLEHDQDVATLLEDMLNACQYAHHVCDMKLAALALYQQAISDLIDLCLTYVREVDTYLKRSFVGRIIQDTSIKSYRAMFQRAKDNFMMGTIVQNLVYGHDLENHERLARLNHFDYKDPVVHGCQYNTRRDVLDTIEEWTASVDPPNVLWLRGSQGSGKTAIATSAQERLAKNGSLGASFFFDRNDKARNNPSAFLESLAGQLSEASKPFADNLAHALQDCPRLRDKPLRDRFRDLLVNPISMGSDSRDPITIIVDGFEQCEGPLEELEQLLEAFQADIAAIPTAVRILFTSCDVPWIRAVFGDHASVRCIDFDQLPTTMLDIELFVRERVMELSRRWGLRMDWAPEELVSKVLKRSTSFKLAASACQAVEHALRSDYKSTTRDRPLSTIINHAVITVSGYWEN